MPEYKVYRNGVEVGTFRPSSNDPSLSIALLIIFIGLGLILIPMWASYKMGQRTWRDYNFFVKLISGFLLALWMIYALLVLGVSLYSLLFGINDRMLLEAVAVSLGILGVIWLTYMIGKSRRRNDEKLA